MKILAIRGCNLASLAGEFEIDLSRAPFSTQGVFAIVGNTGAGKSTLLDALCVALYDRTPRLSNHSRVIVGRGDHDPATLGAHDARTLLRRGAIAGFAEVDFEAADLKRYRARWSVRRARNQTDGALQDQQVSLIALDSDERLSGTKTETLKAIAVRLGLSFDQFRRSALLAQNDFAAFLRADGRDRSELLERMTGTEIYSRLSIAAHLRASLAEQHLRDTRTAALAIPVLEDMARFEAATALGFAEDAKRAGRARLDAAELAARWVAEATTRIAARDAAAAAHAAAITAVADADTIRVELALRKRVESLRPLFDAVLQHAAVSDAIAALDRALAAHDSDRAAQVTTRTLIAADHQIALTALADAQRKAQAFGQRRGVSLDAARKLEDDARVRVADAEQLAAIAARARGAVAARVAIDVRLAELGDIEARAREAEASAITAREHAIVLRGERTRVVDQLRAAAGYAHARTELVEGEPCPLCGAAEHPWRDRGRLDEVIVGAQGSLDEALAHLSAATGTLAAIAARTEQRGVEHARLATDRAAAESTASTARAAWQQHLAAIGELILDGDPASPATAQLAIDRDAAARKQLEAARAARAQAEAVAKAANDAQAGVQLAQAALDQCAGRLTAATHSLADLDAGAERVRGERASRLTQRDELAASMRRVVARLVASEATEHNCDLDDRVDARRGASGATEQGVDLDDNVGAPVASAATERSVDLDSRVDVRPVPGAATERSVDLDSREGARLVAGAATEHSVDLDSRVPARLVADAATEHSVDLDNRVGARLVGSDAAEATRSSGRATPEGKADIDTRARKHLPTRRHATDAQVRPSDDNRGRFRRLDEIEVRLRAVCAHPSDHTHELAAVRALLDELGARSLFATNEQDIANLVAELAAFDAAVVRTAAIAGERVQLVIDHDASRPSEAELADAATLDEIRAAAAAADAHASRAAAVIAADDDARLRRTGALAVLSDDEAKAEVDRILGAVIGSHDGKLFRSFAQSLTLDALLAVANAHLEELAPRYQLERIPRHDLELQVIDRDLGAEVRSVQSLSGGESFLVSLALALGLSSMAAHDVRVRTLLIDEGFGTLDPTALDTALSVLDALQATGRQIGVISHVPALIERVGAHVRVVQRGGGRSEVIVAS